MEKDKIQAHGGVVCFEGNIKDKAEQLTDTEMLLVSRGLPKSEAKVGLCLQGPFVGGKGDRQGLEGREDVRQLNIFCSIFTVKENWLDSAALNLGPLPAFFFVYLGRDCLTYVCALHHSLEACDLSGFTGSQLRGNSAPGGNMSWVPSTMHLDGIQMSLGTLEMMLAGENAIASGIYRVYAPCEEDMGFGEPREKGHGLDVFLTHSLMLER